MPGAEYNGPDREGFMPRDRVVSYLEEYAERFKVPVLYNATVLSVEPLDGKGYRVHTSNSTIQTDNMVIATGLEQLPKVPPFASRISREVAQLHSSEYRNPQAIAPGSVLVVGSAQSGCQIAEELYLSGRRVFLATGNAGRAPRRYRGKDSYEWLDQIGFFDITPDKLPLPREHFAAPHVSGARGGHTLNLHRFARDRVVLLGHLRGAGDNRVWFASDLH